MIQALCVLIRLEIDKAGGRLCQLKIGNGVQINVRYNTTVVRPVSSGIRPNEGIQAALSDKRQVVPTFTDQVGAAVKPPDEPRRVGETCPTGHRFDSHRVHFSLYLRRQGTESQCRTRDVQKGERKNPGSPGDLAA